MKNFLILFLCSSMLCSCLKDEVFSTTASVLLFPFFLFGRTTSDGDKVAEQIEWKNFALDVIQTGEKLTVHFVNKNTGSLETTFTHEKLTVESLQYIHLINDDVQFAYPNGVLTLHLPSKIGSWNTMAEHP